jgi:hypothetical protein
MMGEAEDEFYDEMKTWRKPQLHIIRRLTGEDIVQWTKEYKENVIAHQNKYEGSCNSQNMAMVTLDQETEEMGDVATFAKNSNNIKESKTMYYLENIYIGNSGASCHMVHLSEGMYNIKNIKERITIGNGQYIKALKIGKKKQGMIKLDDGTVMKVVVNNVKYVLEFARYNLFSITQAISSGWMLGNEGKTILLKNRSLVLKFNKMLKTKSGHVAGAEIFP